MSTNNPSYKFKCLYLLFAFFLITYIIIGGLYTYWYPTLNDIIGVLRISAMDDLGKWRNGFYGPGYTLIYNIIGAKILNWAILYIGIMIVSLSLSMVYIMKFLAQFDGLTNSVKYSLGFITIFFYLFLYNKVGLNYTDGLFIYLLFIGLSLYFSSSINSNYSGLQIIGLLVIATTFLFRSHAIIFGVITILTLFLFSKVSYRHILYTLIILFMPFAIYLLILYVNNFQYENWQNFNLYKFFYGVNWYRIDELLDTPQYIDFNLGDTLLDNPYLVLVTILKALKSSFFSVFLIFLMPVVAYYFTKERIFIAIFVICVLYFILILPGWVRGIYPLYILMYFTIVRLYVLTINKNRVWLILFVLIFLYSGVNTYKQAKHLRNSNHYVQYVISSLEPTLEEIGVENINSCFTDDYNLYLYKYNNLLLNNFLGWCNVHPSLKSKKPNSLFKTSSFLKNDIKYIIAKKGGFIEKSYPRIEYKKIIPLKFHNIYILNEHK